jgi:NifU-like protein involved in Fe-S cluster formation
LFDSANGKFVINEKMKNPIIKDHFLNPRHMGTIEHPTHHTIVKSETCSDVVKMMAVINDGIISEIKTQVYGCGYAIAGASIFNELALGKKISEIYGPAIESFNRLLPDIPETNTNCIQLAIKAYKKLFDIPD